jgi:chromatin assembly factor 1 subunit B
LWRIDEKNGQEFLLDLSDHQSAVNVARFSPDGKMLASASERQVVIYVVEDPSMWRNIADVAPLERIWLRPSLNEVFDLQWSPDSSYVIIGAIDNKVTSCAPVLLCSQPLPPRTFLNLHHHSNPYRLKL